MLRTVVVDVRVRCVNVTAVPSANELSLNRIRIEVFNTHVQSRKDKRLMCGHGVDLAKGREI